MNAVTARTSHPRALAIAQRMSLGHGGYPNPEDSGPAPWWGPWAVLDIHAVLTRLRGNPTPGALHPQPEPWRTDFAVGIAQAMVARVIDLHLLAAALPEANRAGVARQASAFMSDVTDWYCGTPPRPLPYPFPGGFAFERHELVIMAGQFARAASFAGAAAGTLHEAAERFAEAGLHGFR